MAQALIFDDMIFIFHGDDWIEFWSMSDGRQYLFGGVCATVSYHSSTNAK
jgi:hypothetical protein